MKTESSRDRDALFSSTRQCPVVGSARGESSAYPASRALNLTMLPPGYQSLFRRPRIPLQLDCVDRPQLCDEKSHAWRVGPQFRLLKGMELEY